MAKVKNLWFRGIKGKLDGAVAYNLNGQQVVRGEAAAVANPRTPAQMSQRVKLANIVNFWRAMRPWGFKHAFESKGRTLSDYNAFTQANLAGSMVALTKEQASAGACILAPYLVTKGTLPSVEVYFNESEGEFGTNLFIGNDSPDISVMTVGMLTERLLANNNGLQVGDQLSFIHVVQSTASQAGVPTLVVRYFEIVLSLGSTTLISDITKQDLLVKTNNGGRTVLGYSVDGEICGVTFIISRTTSGKTQVSSQRLVLGSTDIYDQYTSAAAIAEAAASYGIGQEYFLDTTGSGNGSNGSVPTALSIVGVRKQSLNAIHTPGSEVSAGLLGSPWVIVWNQAAPEFNSDDDVVTIETTGDEVVVGGANVSIDGRMWVVELGLPAGTYLQELRCLTAGGIEYTATFATSNTGDPGDVTP